MERLKTLCLRTAAIHRKLSSLTDFSYLSYSPAMESVTNDGSVRRSESSISDDCEPGGRGDSSRRRRRRFRAWQGRGNLRTGVRRLLRSRVCDRTRLGELGVRVAVSCSW